MADRPAVNASPLIFLARANLLDLLQLAGPDIVVPAPVADEILREGPEDPAARALRATPWMKIVEAQPALEAMRATGMYLSDVVLDRALSLVGE